MWKYVSVLYTAATHTVRCLWAWCNTNHASLYDLNEYAERAQNHTDIQLHADMWVRSPSAARKMAALELPSNTLWNSETSKFTEDYESVRICKPK